MMIFCSVWICVVLSRSELQLAPHWAVKHVPSSGFVPKKRGSPLSIPLSNIYHSISFPNMAISSHFLVRFELSQRHVPLAKYAKGIPGGETKIWQVGCLFQGNENQQLQVGARKKVEIVEIQNLICSLLAGMSTISTKFSDI